MIYLISFLRVALCHLSFVRFQHISPPNQGCHTSVPTPSLSLVYFRLENFRDFGIWFVVGMGVRVGGGGGGFFLYIYIYTLTDGVGGKDGGKGA